MPSGVIIVIIVVFIIIRIVSASKKAKQKQQAGANNPPVRASSQSEWEQMQSFSSSSQTDDCGYEDSAGHIDDGEGYSTWQDDFNMATGATQSYQEEQSEEQRPKAGAGMSVLEQLRQINEGQAYTAQAEAPKPLFSEMPMKQYENLDAKFALSRQLPESEDAYARGEIVSLADHSNVHTLDQSKTHELQFTQDNILNGLIFNEILSAPKARKNAR